MCLPHSLTSWLVRPHPIQDDSPDQRLCDHEHLLGPTVEDLAGICVCVCLCDGIGYILFKHVCFKNLHVYM